MYTQENSIFVQGSAKGAKPWSSIVSTLPCHASLTKQYEPAPKSSRCSSIVCRHALHSKEISPPLRPHQGKLHHPKKIFSKNAT